MPSISQVFDSENESVIQLSSELLVEKQLPRAEQLLRFYFPDYLSSARLPNQLQTWLSSEILSHSRTYSSVQGLATASFARRGKKLIVVAFLGALGGAVTLVLKEDPITLQHYNALMRSMTRRQKDVFHLMADGIRDAETIAEKLGISYRTVEEHRRVINKLLKGLEPGSIPM